MLLQMGHLGHPLTRSRLDRSRMRLAGNRGANTGANEATPKSFTRTRDHTDDSP